MRPIRLIATAMLIGLAFLAAIEFLPHSPGELRELVLAAGLAAPAVALLAWIVLTPALVSGTVLAAAGGLAFGAVGGSLISIAGAVLGGLAAFGLGRTVARSHAEALISKRPALARLRALVARRGFHTILVARLMPGLPSTALHYAAGLSPVRARAFAAAIAIGAVLRTAPYAILGQGLSSGSAASLLLAGGSVAVGGLAAALIGRHIRGTASIPA